MKYLTGEFRFRNEGELLVLQIQEMEFIPSFTGGEDKEIWRDAKVEDLLNVRFCTEPDKKLPEPLEVIR